MAGKRTGSSIATRVSLLTFLAVTSAALLLALISIVGVYRLTLGEDTARIDAYRALLVDDLNSRFGSLDRSIASLAADPATRTTSAGVVTFARAGVPDTEYFASLTLLDAAGQVLARSEQTRSPIPAPVLDAARAAVPGRTAFEWLRPSSAGADGLWVVRAFGPPARRQAVVGLVRSAFLLQAVDRVGTDASSAWALVADAGGRVVYAATGHVPIDGAGTSYGPGVATGTATARSASLGTMQGSWGAVAAGTGLGWRVVVLDSEAGSLARARAALAPAGIATLVVLLLAVLGAAVTSRRLVAPLRLFEHTARDVASGGYIRPINVDRDDEIGRVADAFNEMGVQLNSLQEMAHVLASAASVDDVLDAALNSLGHILGTGDAAVLLADEGASSLVLARGRGLAISEATLVAPLDEDSPLTTAFRDQRAVYFLGDESQGTSAIHRLFNADPHRAGVAVPLTAGDEALGVVVVLAPGRRTLTEAHVDTLRAFTANAAVAVKTSRLFADERLSRTEAEALREVAELTMPATDLARALDRAGAIAAGLLGYLEWGVVLERRYQLGLDVPADPVADAELASVWRLVLAANPDRDPADSTPIVVDEGGEPRLSAILGPTWEHALFVPLLQARTTRGALVLHDLDRGTRPGERHVAVARTIGQEVSLAIRNAHLLQDARGRAMNLETLFRISQAVSSELQPNVVLNRVLDVVQKILSADAVALMSYDDDTSSIETSMARGVRSRDLLYFRTVPGEDIPGAVFQSRAPLVYGGLSHRPTPLAALASEEGLESLLAVPLMARGRAIGVLTVYSRKPDAFSAEDMELLMTFASQAAIAIDTAELYGREHHVSTVLQASILPDVMPDVPGFETASFYLPSGTEAEIGGDYYDMFHTADGRLVLAIGDVCGKGVAAATRTSMIKYSLRGLIGAGLSPANALAELNREVAGGGDPSDIVTVWLGVLDADGNSLVYANGGHPPGLLLRGGSRDIERLAATGPLLGAIEDAAYDERWVTLAEGDMLLLYTDGVTESRRGSHFFGEGRVRRVLRAAQDAQQCIQQLLALVDKFSAGPLRDDAAALAVRRVSADR